MTIKPRALDPQDELQERRTIAPADRLAGNGATGYFQGWGPKL